MKVLSCSITVDELPEHCGSCPISEFDFDNDRLSCFPLLKDFDFKTIIELDLYHQRYKDCPLKLQ